MSLILIISITYWWANGYKVNHFLIICLNEQQAEKLLYPIKYDFLSIHSIHSVIDQNTPNLSCYSDIECCSPVSKLPCVWFDQMMASVTVLVNCNQEETLWHGWGCCTEGCVVMLLCLQTEVVPSLGLCWNPVETLQECWELLHLIPHLQRRPEAPDTFCLEQL